MNNVSIRVASFLLLSAVATGCSDGASGGAPTAPLQSAARNLSCDAVTGPQAELKLWIEPFDANEASNIVFNMAPDLVPYLWEFGGPPYWAWQDQVQLLMFNFALSTNFDPESNSQEHRGFMQIQPSVSCECGAVVGTSAAKSFDPGYTAIRFAEPLPGEIGGGTYYEAGETKPGIDSVTVNGSSATFRYRGYGRLAAPGQWQWTTLLNRGMPWIWSEIEYTLSCNGSYSVKYAASNFPSAKAKLGGTEVGRRAQSGLGAFILSGGESSTPGSNAPGGNFASAAGTAVACDR